MHIQKSILNRLQKLENLTPEKLVILVSVDGAEKECTVDELESNQNARFIRVISGNSNEDVQRILNRIKRIAYEQYGN